MDSRTKWGYLPLVPPRSSQILQLFRGTKTTQLSGRQPSTGVKSDDGEDESTRPGRWVPSSEHQTPDTRHQTPQIRLVGAGQVTSPEVQAGLGSNKAGSRGQVVK